MNEKATIYDYARMCKSVKRLCSTCPLKRLMLNGDPCSTILYSRADEANEIILNWSKEHPIKTRQSEFLKQFPEARISDKGVLEVCPKSIYSYIKCPKNSSCEKCCESYWSEVIG